MSYVSSVLSLSQSFFILFNVCSVYFLHVLLLPSLTSCILCGAGLMIHDDPISNMRVCILPCVGGYESMGRVDSSGRSEIPMSSGIYNERQLPRP